MKITWKNCIKIFVTLFALIACFVYTKQIADFLLVLFKALMPIIVGFCIAYVLNILMSFYERHYFKKSNKKIVLKTRRPVCLVAAMLTLVGIVTALFYLVIPELVSCVKFLVAEVPKLIEKLLSNRHIERIFSDELRLALNSIDWMSYVKKFLGIIGTGIGTAVEVVISAVASVVSGVVTAFIAVIFSIYLLLSKERLKSQCDHFVRGYLSDKNVSRIYYVLNTLNKNFHHFIVGQCTDAVIIGVLCALGMLILGFPYAGMIGALVGFTALIPVAGAYIGAVIGAVMMLTQSPATALLFIIYIIILQQLEGNLIYPKVVGNSIGLPALWVLAAVTVGGGLMGVFGMLIMVPIVATAYQLLATDVNRRIKLKVKKIKQKDN